MKWRNEPRLRGSLSLDLLLSFFWEDSSFKLCENHRLHFVKIEMCAPQVSARNTLNYINETFILTPNLFNVLRQVVSFHGYTIRTAAKQWEISENLPRTLRKSPTCVWASPTKSKQEAIFKSFRALYEGCLLFSPDFYRLEPNLLDQWTWIHHILPPFNQVLPTPHFIHYALYHYLLNQKFLLSFH